MKKCDKNDKIFSLIEIQQIVRGGYLKRSFIIHWWYSYLNRFISVRVKTETDWVSLSQLVSFISSDLYSSSLQIKCLIIIETKGQLKCNSTHVKWSQIMWGPQQKW